MSNIEQNNNTVKTQSNQPSMSTQSTSQSSYYNSYEETSAEKLARKSKDNPFFPIAMTGFGLALLYGAYRFKYRGDMPISLYLIHLRVGAQGVAVGSLSVGMVYMLGKRLYNRIYDIPNDKSTKRIS